MNYVDKTCETYKAYFKAQLENWIVAEKSFIEYFEDIEEEGAYPDLYGKCIQVNKNQFSEIDQIIQQIAIELDIPTPKCFVYESYKYLVDSEGINQPRIEISSRLAQDFSITELTHVIAKEMYHIAIDDIKTEVLIEKMLSLINSIPTLPGINMIQVFGGEKAFELAGFHFRTIAFNWFKYACFSADNFAINYTKNVKSSIRATLLTIFNERNIVQNIKVIDCSVSKPSGIKEINPVRDFLLNLKQKRKSNESTFKSRETYKRNTT